MAVEFGDNTSGFRHTEVVRFINNEILINGGGPEFYMNFHSRSWNEIEDRLLAILIDPKVSRPLKRACTWSALALSVRVVARQREQQARRVDRLQEQVGERETASWTLASELQRLRADRDQANAQLLATQNALQEAMDEREVLRGRLLQAERSAQADSLPQDFGRKAGVEHSRAVAWSLDKREQTEAASRRTQNIPNLEIPMPAPTTLSYVAGPTGSWVQAVQPFVGFPVPPLPLGTSISVGFPYSTPVPCPVVMESGVTAPSASPVISQIPPIGIYSPGLWVTQSPQEAMTSQRGQVFHRQNECSETLQSRCQVGNNINQKQASQENLQGISPPIDNSSQSHKDQVIHQELVSPRDSTSHTEKTNLKMLQETTSLEFSTSHSLKEDSVMLQGEVSQGNSISYNQNKYPEGPQKMADLGDSITCGMEEDPKISQGTAAQGNNTKYSQKKYPGTPQKNYHLGESTSYNLQEDSVMSQWTDSQENISCSQKKYPGLSPRMPHLRNNNSHNVREDSPIPQGMAAQGSNTHYNLKIHSGVPQKKTHQENNINRSQKEDPKIPQGKPPLGGSTKHCQKNNNTLKPKQMTHLGTGMNHNQKTDQVAPQGMVSLGAGKNHSHKEGQEKPQTSPLGKSRSQSAQSVNKYPKKQPPPKQKTKQSQGTKASEFKQQENPASNPTQKNWVCPSCKAVNHPWRKACYKCKNVGVPLESRDAELRQA